MDSSKAGGLIHTRSGQPRGFHTLLFPRPRGCDIWWQDGYGLGSACPSFTWRSQDNSTMQFVLKISLLGHRLVDMDKGLSLDIVRHRKGNDLQIQISLSGPISWTLWLDLQSCRIRREGLPGSVGYGENYTATRHTHQQAPHSQRIVLE